MMIVASIREFYADQQITSSFRVFTCQHGSHLQFTPEGLGINLSALVSEDGPSRNHFQIGQLRNTVYQRISYPIAEVFSFRTASDVCKWQNRDGIHRRTQRKDVVRAIPHDSQQNRKRKS